MPVIGTIVSYIFLNKMKYYLENGKSTSINKAKFHILKVLANKDSLQQIIPVILQFFLGGGGGGGAGNFLRDSLYPVHL